MLGAFAAWFAVSGSKGARDLGGTWEIKVYFVYSVSLNRCYNTNSKTKLARPSTPLQIGTVGISILSEC
jgi:hypothetical protein